MLHYLLVWWFFYIRKWKVVGSFPYHLKKSVIIVAPHTHSNDFWAGMALRKKIHLEFVHFLGKKELFIPPFSWILRALGGQPVDRSNKHHLVDQIVQVFNDHDSYHLVLSPEGTRKKVEKLKSGFYHIAKNAHVPIVMIGMDFGTKTFVIAPALNLSDDSTKDKRQIIEFFSQFKGYKPEYGITPETIC
jgi:1-acyl-sn-glycerol-3-phosphate acyltransferase